MPTTPAGTRRPNESAILLGARFRLAVAISSARGIPIGLVMHLRAAFGSVRAGEVMHARTHRTATRDVLTRRSDLMKLAPRD